MLIAQSSLTVQICLGMSLTEGSGAEHERTIDHSLHSEVKIIDDVLHDVFWEHSERHRYFLGKR